MLFNISYRQQDETKQLSVSGTSMSNVLVYCDANNITPITISNVNFAVILNQTSLNYCYTVNLSDQNNEQSSTVIYDTFENVITWINSQTGKTTQSLNKIDRAFVTA
jgi:hypothetical protein